MGTTRGITVDSTNTDQLRAWDGDEGAYWAAHAEQFDRAVAAHHDRLFDAAAISVRDRVLDVGCGTGKTTRDAARTASGGSALGIDLSAAMLHHAQQAADAEGLTNVSFVHGDAQIHPFEPGSFDIVVSRTGASFFGDPSSAFQNLARALSPSGRLALVTWQGGRKNEWIREITGALDAGRGLPIPAATAPGPFALSDPDRVRSILTSSGFSAVEIEDLQAPMWFGVDAEAAHGFMLGLLGWMLEGLDGDQRARARDHLLATMARHETSEGVLLQSAAWVVTASRR